MFGKTSAGTLYIRFRNGDNPNNKKLRYNGGGAGFTIRDASYVTVRNLEIQGACWAIAIGGGAIPSDHNVIEENHLTNGLMRLYFMHNASHNKVRNNFMELKMIGPEKYGDDCWRYNPADRYSMYASWNLYAQNKFPVCAGSENTAAIMFQGKMSFYNEISNNRLNRNGVGILFNGGDTGTSVYGNEIRGNFNQCIRILGSTLTCKIFDNLIADGGQYMIRHESGTKGPFYIYRNRFWNRGNKRNGYAFMGGTHLATTWLYHNSFSGASNSLGHGGDAPNLRIVNNVSSSRLTTDSPLSVAVYDYNWDVASSIVSGGTHNIHASAQIWPDSLNLPNFLLPAGHAAIATGLDVSKTFTVQGQTYPALPGMIPGYFGAKKAPDRGVYPDGKIPSIFTTEENFSLSKGKDAAFRIVSDDVGNGAKLIYSLPKPGHIRIEMFDVTGRLVQKIFEGNAAAGSQDIVFSCRSQNGTGFHSGIYFFRFCTEKNSQIVRARILR